MVVLSAAGVLLPTRADRVAGEAVDCPEDTSHVVETKLEDAFKYGVIQAQLNPLVHASVRDYAFSGEYTYFEKTKVRSQRELNSLEKKNPEALHSRRWKLLLTTFRSMAMSRLLLCDLISGSILGSRRTSIDLGFVLLLIDTELDFEDRDVERGESQPHLLPDTRFPSFRYLFIDQDGLKVRDASSEYCEHGRRTVVIK